MTTLPIILAGGSGTRLWPLSRKAHPKQFIPLVDHQSLLQKTYERIIHLEHVANPFVICNEAHYFLCMDQLSEISDRSIEYIIEPIGRNTAPAIAIAAFQAQAIHDDDPILLILPADHLIEDQLAFEQTLDQAISLAKQGNLVTFSIPPTSPQTGYGYIQTGNQLGDHAFHIDAFVEKPDLKTAKKYIEEKNYYWNSGMFAFQASSYLEELKKHAPDIYESAKIAFQTANHQNNFLRLDKTSFEDCRDESIDYAVMEKTDNAATILLNSGWSDLGCWKMVADAHAKDEHNNVKRGNVIAMHSKNSFMSSEGRLVASIGLENHMVVSTKDAVLVAHKDYSQDVKNLVNKLKQSTFEELTETHKQVHRPWGYYERLINGEHFQVKLLMVKPNAKLSLQMHYKRAEHWVVVSGEAEIVNGNETFRLHANESTYIPKETKHRLGNPTDLPLQIIEVQTGEYLGEDDIVRFEDVYERVCSE